MKQTQYGMLLAGMLAAGLAGCSATGMDAGTSASTRSTSVGTPAGTPVGTPAGTPEISRDTASTMSSMTATELGSSGPGDAVDMPNSTVSNIEIIPRQGQGTGLAAGVMAGAAVGGSTGVESGASATPNRVYRITLRMDDGSTKVVTQESTPSFGMGARVRTTGESIHRSLLNGK